MPSFSELVADMDTALLETLKDGRVDFLAAAGSVAVEGLDAIVDTDVQRINEVSGFVDRVVTVCVSKAALGAYDRKGGVRSNSIEPVKYLVGKNWHLDGIASDDGDLITFYLVP